MKLVTFEKRALGNKWIVYTKREYTKRVYTEETVFMKPGECIGIMDIGWINGFSYLNQHFWSTWKGRKNTGKKYKTIKKP